ncbi:hypothetical protein FrEUN1fDRAFT_5506 [Parafrankia sp. EUN1f]|nr:hypothetical protein FrEUN1fDRAFT_5506 [Parafrankia sp. EUN1f]
MKDSGCFDDQNPPFLRIARWPYARFAALIPSASNPQILPSGSREPGAGSREPGAGIVYTLPRQAWFASGAGASSSRDRGLGTAASRWAAAIAAVAS